MINFKEYCLQEWGNASGNFNRPKNGPDILSIGEPLGRNPGGFKGDGSTNREAMPDTMILKKKKKGKKNKKSVKKKLDAQSVIDKPMQNRPMLNWT